MRAIKTYAFLLCALAVLAAHDFVRAGEVTLDAERLKQFVVSAPKPRYPSRAWREYKTGAGSFLLNIDDEKGVVTSIKIEKTTGLWSLDVACLKALINWRFKPHTLTKVRVPVRFVHN
jgi:TonB family protein